MMKRILFLFGLFLVAGLARSQVVYEDISNTGIYEFLDELATLRLITLNSAIKPYSRSYIAGKLNEARVADTLTNLKTGKPLYRLNKRQRKELSFYLQDFQLEASYRVKLHRSRRWVQIRVTAKDFPSKLEGSFSGQSYKHFTRSKLRP